MGSLPALQRSSSALHLNVLLSHRSWWLIHALVTSEWNKLLDDTWDAICNTETKEAVLCHWPQAFDFAVITFQSWNHNHETVLQDPFYWPQKKGQRYWPSGMPWLPEDRVDWDLGCVCVCVCGVAGGRGVLQIRAKVALLLENGTSIITISFYFNKISFPSSKGGSQSAFSLRWF
jgi:hypothetical protein